MAHVQMRDGKVVGMFGGPQPDNDGYLEIADNDVRLVEFNTPTAEEIAVKELTSTDSKMFQALENLIDVLIAKGTISAKDLTPKLAQLYADRKAVRDKLDKAESADADAVAIAEADAIPFRRS